MSNPAAMTTEPLLVGLDVGTTNVKALIVRPNGETVALSTAPQETEYPHPGWASHSPEGIWELCCRVLREAVSQLPDPTQIAGVAVASMGEAGVTLDEDGEPTYEIIAWFDRRTVQQTEQFTAQIGAEELFAITGAELQPIYTAPKLMWIRDTQPEAWARTRRFLNVSAYIAFRLGAEMAQDHSLASRTGLFDLRTRDWSDQLLGIAGLRRDLFADLTAGWNTHWLGFSSCRGIHRLAGRNRDRHGRPRPPLRCTRGGGYPAGRCSRFDRHCGGFAGRAG